MTVKVILTGNFMDNTTFHPDENPFDRFLKNPELDMFRAALPYVSGSMRIPLAISIKMLEMMHIFSDFDNEEVLSACGFDNYTPNPEAMLNAMKLASGPDGSPRINQLLHMMHMVKTYQRLNDMLNSNPELLKMLTNLMNQMQNSNMQKSVSPLQPGTASSNSSSIPADLLKQFENGDTSNLLKQFGNDDVGELFSLFSQMLKNSR